MLKGDSASAAFASKRKGSGNDQIIGRDDTNSAGKWSLKEPGASGRFYAQVKQKTQPSGAPCLATKSQAIGVG